MHLMHQIRHEIDIFEENLEVLPEVRLIGIYRCNLHFRKKQKILKYPVAQKPIPEEKSAFQGTEESQKCIMHYNAFMELPDEG